MSDSFAGRQRPASQGGASDQDWRGCIRHVHNRDDGAVKLEMVTSARRRVVRRGYAIIVSAEVSGQVRLRTAFG